MFYSLLSLINDILRELQAFGSSVSQLIYNMFGYFLSPIFSATIMDTFDDKLKGMKWGFRLNQFISVIAVILVVILIKILRKRNYRERKNDSKYEVKLNKI